MNRKTVFIIMIMPVNCFLAAAADIIAISSCHKTKNPAFCGTFGGEKRGFVELFRGRAESIINILAKGWWRNGLLTDV